MAGELNEKETYSFAWSGVRVAAVRRELFCAASLFLRSTVPGTGYEGEACGLGARALGATATTLMLARLPTLDVCLSDSPAGRRLREHFDDRMWGIRHSRLAQGVLTLPEEHAVYLRGRSRQALRTNIHRARDARIACRALEHLGGRRVAVGEMRRRDRDGLPLSDTQLCLPGDMWWSASNLRGETVALAQVTVDGEWAVLQSFVSSHRPSRSLLHSEMVRGLIARGVRQLTVDAPMAPLLEPSLQYWQRLLGFRVVNLSVRSAPVGEPADGAVSESDAFELLAQRPPETTREPILALRGS